MVDRSEPLVVTPQACPFVALDGDRDQRLSVPDPMHRCFAEAAPKARSIGHQASFCLSPAFTGCPIFLDWAARVAADVAQAPLASSAASVAAPATVVATPATSVATPATAGVGVATSATQAVGSATVLTTATPAGGMPPSATAASTAPPGSGGSTSTTSRPAWAAAPAWIAEATPPPDMFDDPTRRTARLEIDPGASASAPPSVASDPTRVMDVDATDEAAAELAAATARTDLVGGPDGYPTPMGPEGMSGPGPDAEASATDDGAGNVPPWSRGRPRVPLDAGAPASLGPQTRPGARPAGPREWEGARRFEAYAAGTGASRLRRPVLIATAAVLVAAAVLVVFLLPSIFMSSGAAPSATPGTSSVPGAAATHKPKPTATAPGATPARPPATPQSYRVKRGDTLLRIARRFNVTVDQLTCANDIRNPDSLSVGATLTIPIESYECPRPTKKPR